MSRKLSILATIFMAIIVIAGVAVAKPKMTNVSAQDSSEPWSMIVSQYRCDECYAEWGSVEGMSLEDLAEQGDPDGDMSLAVNVMARLAVDNCEWQWQVLADGVAVMIIYRC